MSKRFGMIFHFFNFKRGFAYFLLSYSYYCSFYNLKKKLPKVDTNRRLNAINLSSHVNHIEKLTQIDPTFFSVNSKGKFWY